METSEIRDKLLTQKALYEESVRQSAQAMQNIRNILDSVTDAEIEIIQETVNFDYRYIKNFDLERMKTDSGYLQECTAKLNQLIEALHKYLEEALNV